MNKKILTSYRFGADDLERIKQLANLFDRNRSDTIRLIIRRVYDAVNHEKESEPAQVVNHEPRQ